MRRRLSPPSDIRSTALTHLLISVKPVDRGWAVLVEGLEPALFQSGSQAETHARRIASANSELGSSVKLEVFDRDDRFVGAVSFPPGVSNRPRPLPFE